MLRIAQAHEIKIGRQVNTDTDKASKSIISADTIASLIIGASLQRMQTRW